MKVLIILFLFSLLWVFCCRVIASVGGWTELASKYRCDNPRATWWSGWLSGQVGGAYYYSCLWLAAAPEGLYLKTGPLFLFRAFHPPLLIPWAVIKSAAVYKSPVTSDLSIQVENCRLSFTVQGPILDESKRFLADKLSSPEAG